MWLSGLKNPTSIPEDVGWIPGLAHLRKKKAAAVSCDAHLQAPSSPANQKLWGGAIGWMGAPTVGGPGLKGLGLSRLWAGARASIPQGPSIPVTLAPPGGSERQDLHPPPSWRRKPRRRRQEGAGTPWSRGRTQAPPPRWSSPQPRGPHPEKKRARGARPRCFLPADPNLGVGVELSLQGPRVWEGWGSAGVLGDN